IGRGAGTDLYDGADLKSARRVANSAPGETWSDLNWSPDGASLLLAVHTGPATDKHSHLLLINADGSTPTGFGSNQRDYSNPLWSPRADLVLFSRRDEAGGTSLWTAKATVGSPSAVDNAESQALAEVDKFMQARIKGDLSGAQAQLDSAAQQAYNNGASNLLSPGAQFARYYPVSVQLAGTNKFLIGARLFIARNNIETSFFEEQLTVVLQDQRYLIDAVTATATVQLGRGPTVVSVEVRQGGAAQQILVRFDSDLKPDSVSADTILVKDSQGTPVKTRVSFDPDGHLVTLEVKLKSGRYSLVITNGVADINGAPISESYTTPLVIGG
ncbi:MAG TPA: Ig-like domain-containing protein, partial [Candidatus Dormibacteraeota bacterium]